MTLRSDIQTAASTDAALSAALVAQDTQAITDAYNALGSRKKVEPVPITLLSAWAAPSVRAKLQDHADNVASPVRSLCLSALDLFGGAMSPTFDTVTYGGLLDVLVAAGVATDTERAQLTAMASVPDTVGEMDVRLAFWADDGSWLGV